MKRRVVRRSLAAASVAVALFLAVFLAVFFGGFAALLSGVGMTGPGVAKAQAPGDLQVIPGRLLSLVGEEASLKLVGPGLEQLYSTGGTVVVRLEGPARAEEVGQAEVRLPLVRELAIGMRPDELKPSADARVGGEGGADLSAGQGSAGRGPASAGEDLLLPLRRWGGEALVIPGAYRVTVSVQVGGTTVGSGQTWLGKVAPREQPLRLALIWPLALGIHRDPDGVFFDRKLEEAVDRSTEGAGLAGFLWLSERYPTIKCTLVVEPVLLTQLRDMADGYLRTGDTGGPATGSSPSAASPGGAAQVGPPEEVPASDARAQDAAASLAELQALVADGRASVLALPYASPDLAVLAARARRDGVGQLQLGKQELQQTLGLSAPVTGVYLADQEITPACLSLLGQAAVDHAVGPSSLASRLSEPLEPGSITVRVRNEEHDRVTLILADDGLSGLLTPPGDAGLFFARLAAELASRPLTDLVVAPPVTFELPSPAFVEKVYHELLTSSWLATITVADLLQSRPPASRPLLLKGNASAPRPGYLEESLLAAVGSAGAVVRQLSDIADVTRVPVERSRRLLYLAESRFWYREGASLEEANVGLKYATQAESLAKGELAKVAISKLESDWFWGRQGTLTLLVENDAAYPVTVGLHLTGDGLSLAIAGVKAGDSSGAGEQASDREELAPDRNGSTEARGELTQVVELLPGVTTVDVRVSATGGLHGLKARLTTGTTSGAVVLTEAATSVGFITWPWLARWVGLALGLIVVSLTVLVLLRRRRRAAATSHRPVR